MLYQYLRLFKKSGIYDNEIYFFQIHDKEKIIFHNDLLLSLKSVFYHFNPCFLVFFFTHINVYCCSNFDLNYIFLLSSLHLHLYEICFVKVFDSFIHVIILRTFKLIISVLFATHILPDFHRESYNFHCVYLV